MKLHHLIIIAALSGCAVVSPYIDDLTDTDIVARCQGVYASGLRLAATWHAELDADQANALRAKAVAYEAVCGDHVVVSAVAQAYCIADTGYRDAWSAAAGECAIGEDVADAP